MVLICDSMVGHEIWNKYLSYCSGSGQLARGELRNSYSTVVWVLRLVNVPSPRAIARGQGAFASRKPRLLYYNCYKSNLVGYLRYSLATMHAWQPYLQKYLATVHTVFVLAGPK